MEMFLLKSTVLNGLKNLTALSFATHTTPGLDGMKKTRLSQSDQSSCLERKGTPIQFE